MIRPPSRSPRPDTLLPDTTLFGSVSGDGASDASVDSAWDGKPLTSMQRVWWSVEVEDDRGTTTTSAPAWFETGLLSPDDWRAQWIEAEDPLAKADRAAGLRWVWSPTAQIGRAHV